MMFLLGFLLRLVRAEGSRLADLLNVLAARSRRGEFGRLGGQIEKLKPRPQAGYSDIQGVLSQLLNYLLPGFLGRARLLLVFRSILLRRQEFRRRGKLGSLHRFGRSAALLASLD